MAKGAIPFWERVGCSVDDAITATSLGRTKIYGLLAEGRLKSTMVDGRRVISIASLRQLIDGEALNNAA